MSFTARLLSDLISVEAGATVPLAIEVVNKDSTKDRLEVQIDGLDSEWTAVPVPVFNIEAGETVSEKLFFKPPRASESLAGNYPFVLTIRSLESGDSKAMQGVLQIKPFHHLSMEVLPKKGSVTPLRKVETYTLTVMNLGNTEHTLQLLGSDPDDACAFEFEHEQVTVGPGQQKNVEVSVSATSSHLFTGSQLVGFTISGRSIESPSVLANAQAQLEQRPMVTPGGLLALLLFAIIFAFWAYLIPKPPTLDLTLGDHEIDYGRSVIIQWQAKNANNVWVKADGHVIVDAGPAEGEQSYKPKRSGTIEIEAYARRDNKFSKLQQLELMVDPPPVIPDPKILSFTGPDKAFVGVPFQLSYELGDGVESAYIAPTQDRVDLNVNEIQLVPTTPGTITYTLVAQNSAGKAVKRSLKVQVQEMCKAVIVSFTASDSTVDPIIGKVTLSWQITDAKSATISDGSQTKVLDLTTNSLDIPVLKATTFTLTAYDEKGMSVSRTVKVNVATPTPPPSGATEEGE